MIRQPSVQTIPRLFKKLADIIEGLVLSNRCKKNSSGLPDHLRNEEEMQNMLYQKMLIETVQKLEQELGQSGGFDVED